MNKKKYLRLLGEKENPIEAYKDKNGTLILFYYNEDGKKEIDIDPIYRKKDRHSSGELFWCCQALGDRYHLCLRETCKILSAAMYYEYCIYALRFNKPARRWFKKRAHEMVFKDGYRLTDFLLPSGRLDWEKLKSL